MSWEVDPEEELVDGRYRPLRLLGEGGMGRVILAEEVALGRPVALKQIRLAAWKDDVRWRKRLLNEARAASRIRHPACVEIYGVGEHEGVLYIAMEFIDGESLYDLLSRRKTLSGERIARILIEVCEVLAEAHEMGVLHRDIKPDNIMLIAGRPERVKLVDFGLALPMASKERLTEEGMVLGTPDYMSPEQALSEELDGRADLYAVGAVLFEALCGRPPFVASTTNAKLIEHVYNEPLLPSEVNAQAQIHPSLEALALWALAKEPASRPQTGLEMAEELRAAVMLIESGEIEPLHRQRKRAIPAGGRAERARRAGIPEQGVRPLDTLLQTKAEASAGQVVVFEPAGPFSASLTAQLRAGGHQITTVRAIDAETLAGIEDPIALVLDLRRGLEGIEALAQAVKENGLAASSLVIGADDALPELPRLIELGFGDFLAAALVRDKLGHRLSRLIRRGRRERSSKAKESR